MAIVIWSIHEVSGSKECELLTKPRLYCSIDAVLRSINEVYRSIGVVLRCIDVILCSIHVVLSSIDVVISSITVVLSIIESINIAVITYFVVLM